MKRQLEYLQNQKGIRLATPGPYKGVSKSIVEKSFDTQQGALKGRVVGEVKGSGVKKRGDKDYRLEACLTIEEFEKALVGHILTYNLNKVLPRDDVDPRYSSSESVTPLKLWNWGIKNCTGLPQKIAEDELMQALLPRYNATTSDKGLCVHGIYYQCDKFFSDGWFYRKGFGKRPESVEIAYDPRCMDRIYVLPSKYNSQTLVAHISDMSNAFRGQSLTEIQERKSAQKEADDIAEEWYDDNVAYLNQQLAETTRSAAQNKNSRGYTKAERLRGMSENRKKAVQDERANYPTIKSDESEIQGYQPDDLEPTDTEFFHDPEISNLLQPTHKDVQ